MIQPAEVFQQKLIDENVSGFAVRELADERKSTIFESQLQLGDVSLPIAVIIDVTPYTTIRVRLAENSVDDTNAMLLTGWLMRQSQESRLIKYYLTPNTTIIADAVYVHDPEKFDPDVLVPLLRVFVRDIEKIYPELKELLPE